MTVIMNNNSSKCDRWVRRFTTDATHKHTNGFTIYKITSYLFPLASPEAVTVLTVWKRYSDLQILQRAMKKMHQQLYLKGSCPVYNKWGYFRRFDPEVIQDRMTSTQALLEFIAQHPPLFTSEDFVKFFQSSYPDPDIEEGNTGNIESIRRSLLLPVEVIGPLDPVQTSEDDSFSTPDSNSASPLDMASLNDHIVYRNDAGQPIASYPKSPIQSVARGTLEDVAEVVVLPNPLSPKPCDNNSASKSADNAPSNKSNANSSMENSSESVEVAEQTATKLNLPDLLAFDSRLNMDVSQTTSESSTDSLSFLDSPSFDCNRDLRNNDLISFTKPSDSVMSLQAGFPNTSTNGCNANERIRKTSAPNGATSEDKVDSTSCNTMSRSSSRLDTMSVDSLFGSTSDLQESYVFEAGYLLSLGARNEAKGEYQKAFDFYKAGIEKMLIGVQGDTNEFRRQFVRDKTNKYLSYAEKIYNNHLNNPDNMMSPVVAASPPIHRPLKTCDVSSLRHPYEDLSKYKVLGIIGGQVMLVLCTHTQHYYAMKVVQKTCNQIADEDYFKNPLVDGQLPIMPTNIPYMVRLLAFIDTPNLLFFVLQYASGGKLFDYIQNYVKTVTETPKREVNLENVFVDLEEMARKRNKSKNLDGDKSFSETNTCGAKTAALNEEKDSPTSVPTQDSLNLSVTDIVNKSQRLLLNVDEALSGRFKAERDTIDLSAGDGSTETIKDTETDSGDSKGMSEGIIIESDNIRYKISANRSALSPKSLCNWCAELLTAIESLHECGVYCRNLNPDNLLLGEQGHLVISYMVGWNIRESLTRLVNQDKLLDDIYIAPEMQTFPLLDNNYDERLADFWSFGAIVYELLSGLPLSITHPTGFNSHTIFNIPEGLSQEAESLLTQLLCYDPCERLGSGPNGIGDIKSHPYFSQIDWDHLKCIYDEESYS